MGMEEEPGTVPSSVEEQDILDAPTYLRDRDASDRIRILSEEDAKEPEDPEAQPNDESRQHDPNSESLTEIVNR